MQFVRRFLIALLLLGAAAAAPAQDFKAGRDYLVLPTPQPVDTGKKVEVIYFFHYACPHCNVFEPKVMAWAKKHGDNIVLKRVHVQWREDFIPQQRLYYTLESMGNLEGMHDKVFHAMHVERQRLNRDEVIFDWVAKHGIDRTRFSDTYRSFGVQAKVRRAGTLQQNYVVEMWPNIVIDGKYQTSPSQGSQHIEPQPHEDQQVERALQIMDMLVARAKAEKK
jgi:thiol:disulfide interchange protein DsbA